MHGIQLNLVKYIYMPVYTVYVCYLYRKIYIYRMRLKKMWWCLHRNNLATNRVINTKFSDFIKQPILHSGSKFQANSSNICIVIEILLREHRKQKSTCKHRVAQRLNDVF